MPADLKPDIMEASEKFDNLCSELLGAGCFSSGNFSELCRKHNVDETDMDNLFYENFGMSGEEVFYKLLGYTIVIAV